MILVSGASGFIGRRVVLALQRDQVPFCGLVQQGPLGSNQALGTLSSLSDLREACAGVTSVYHCAGYAHASDSVKQWQVNFEGTRNLVTIAGMAGVKRFVFLSSVKAMADSGEQCVDEDWPGEPTTSYGKAKRAAEVAVLEAGAKYGMHVVNLRLAMVYGPGGRGNLERMARVIRTGWFPPVPETGNRRSLVYVDDVVAVIRLVAESPTASGNTYVVAAARAYSGRELYDAIRAALDVRTVHWSIPRGILRAGGRVGDRLGALLRRPLPLNSEVVSRLLDSAWYTPARIEREVGWRARVELPEGLRAMLGDKPVG